MSCRMEWTAADGSQHRCGEPVPHDGRHSCTCAAVFTFGGPP
jgi:hypothetical protein